MPSDAAAARADVGAAVFATSTVVLGIDLLQVLPPLVMSQTGTPRGYLPALVGVVVLAAVAWLAHRTIGTADERPGQRTPLLVVAGVGVGAARLLLQAGLPDVVELAAAAAGAASFGVALTVLVQRAPSVVPLGLLVGVAIDAATAAATATLGFQWADRWWVRGLVLTVVLAHLAGLVSLRRADREPLPGAVPVVAVGPVLLAQLLVFANPGWLAQAADLGPDAAAAVAVAGAAVGVLRVVGAEVRLPPSPVVADALLATGSLAVAAVVAGPPVLLAVFVGQWAVAGVLARLLGRPSPDRAQPSAPAVAAAHVAGLLLAAVGAAAYSAATTVLGPARGGQLLLVLGVVVGLAVMIRPAAPRRPQPSAAATGLGAALGLALVPLALWAGLLPLVAEAGAAPSQLAERPLRVATFNVHRGFGTTAEVRLEAMARAIEATDADVVGLQEVARGSVLDGSVDTLAWLSHTLGYPHVVYQPVSENGLTGNALLSRLPARAVERVPLASESVPRGALVTRVQVRGGDPLLVVVTHFDAGLPAADSQAAAVARRLDDRRRALVLGDLNATIGSPILSRLRSAGLEPVDAGATYPARSPMVQLDWILVGRGLTATDSRVVPATASDHRPVTVTLDVRLTAR